MRGSNYDPLVCGSFPAPSMHKSISNPKRSVIAPAGILSRGKIPRRHPYSSRVKKVKGSKVLTVKIYSIYTRSNLDLPEQGAHGISG